LLERGDAAEANAELIDREEWRRRSHGSYGNLICPLTSIVCESAL
jgi:hypothetical protein